MRAALVVFDGLGIGALPDAVRYGDAGSHTLANTARAVGGLHVPTLQRLGLGTLAPLAGVSPRDDHEAAVGILAQQSAGKDSTSGHWELAGLILRQPFPTYPDGFPPEVIAAFSRAIGRPILGNVAASGTEILERLGPEHLRTGAPIVYTSADSVFQIAAHEDVVPVEELYRWCEVARGLLRGEHAVGRVIARPFTGAPGAFTRTPRRRDFALPPPAPTVLDVLTAAGLPVVGIGKVHDIFAGRGVARSEPTISDRDGLDRLAAVLGELPRGLAFATLTDLDTKYGHRNDAVGYARHLQVLDARLPDVLAAARPGDLVLLTADHGNDPTTPSTDHSREHVPLLAWRPGLAPGIRLGLRETFADVAATLAEGFGVPWGGPGLSFWPALRGLPPARGTR